MKTIEEQIKLHEGLRNKPYRDTVGKLTIGVGRNLDDVGISDEEAKYLLRNDLKKVKEKLCKYDWFTKLDYIRMKVVLDMAFNLGIKGLLSFKNMIKALKEEDYTQASKEMINSKWYRQVGYRAERLVRMMRTGKDYDEV